MVLRQAIFAEITKIVIPKMMKTVQNRLKNTRKFTKP